MTFPVRAWPPRLFLAGALAGAFLFAGAAGAQGFRAVFSRDGTDVWAVGDAGAVWRSFDGGANWTATPAQGTGVLYGIPLGPGATLLLGPGRAEISISRDDLNALRAAAAPLLKLLETRGLIGKMKGPSS